MCAAAVAHSHRRRCCKILLVHAGSVDGTGSQVAMREQALQISSSCAIPNGRNAKFCIDHHQRRIGRFLGRRDCARLPGRDLLLPSLTPSSSSAPVLARASPSSSKAHAHAHAPAPSNRAPLAPKRKPFDADPRPPSRTRTSMLSPRRSVGLFGGAYSPTTPAHPPSPAAGAAEPPTSAIPDSGSRPSDVLANRMHEVKRITKSLVSYFEGGSAFWLGGGRGRCTCVAARSAGAGDGTERCSALDWRARSMDRLPLVGRRAGHRAGESHTTADSRGRTRGRHEEFPGARLVASH